MTDSKKALFFFLLFYFGFFIFSGFLRIILLLMIIFAFGKRLFCECEKLSVRYLLCAFCGMAFYVLAKFAVQCMPFSGGYSAESFSPSVWFFIDVLILTPLAEELLFRSCLDDVLQGISVSFFILLSTVLFAAVHLSQGIGGIFFAIMCGLMLSFTYKMKKKIIFSVIIHSFINLGGCLDCIFF